MKKLIYFPYLVLIPFVHTVLYSILNEIFLLNENLSVTLLGIIVGVLTIFFTGLYYFKGIEFFKDLYLDSTFRVYMTTWIALTIYINVLLVHYMFPGIIYLIINLIIYQNVTSNCLNKEK